MPSHSKFLKIAQVSDALADAHRQKILWLLKENESLNVSELTTKFDLSRPAVVHHLKLLHLHGLLNKRKEGKEVYYTINQHSILNHIESLKSLFTTP